MAKKAESKQKSIEKEYVIPLRNKIQHVPKHKRAKKAVRIIREFLLRHMKIRDGDLKKIKIDLYLNEAIWIRGIKNPPIKIKVKAIHNKEDGIVRAELIDFPKKLKFKKLREEKQKLKAIETGKKKIEKVVEDKPAESKKTEEEKKEEQEKVQAGEETTKKLEKAHAKQRKKQAFPKTKQPKHQIRKALAK